MREGAIVKLSDDEGRVGYGEIAPLVDFGTESLVSALARCAQLKEVFHPEGSREVWAKTFCLSHAVEAALEMMEWSEDRVDEVSPAWPICGLMSGSDPDRELDELRDFGFRSVKIKIGVEPREDEMRKVAALAERSNGELPIRLDANGGLSLRQAIEWMELASEFGIEFVEQPLPRGEEESMMKLAADYPTLIALDESIVNPDDLKRERDRHWPGLYVIKPLIAGGLLGLRKELGQGDASKFVFSSALESVFGAAVGLRLALAFRNETSRALGFGAGRLFANDNFGYKTEPFLQTGGVPRIDSLSELWSQI